MPRSFAALGGLVLVAITIGLTGCGSISTEPMRSSAVKLTPNPPVIYVAPFNTETARWEVGRSGVELVDFKREFQTQFLHKLEDRLEGLAPTKTRWVDDLPNHGWLVSGEFITVSQGSRALRTAVGLGLGQTTFQTNVYVYDLDVSKTQYVMAFKTGVPNGQEGAGSGSDQPSGLTTAGEPVSTSIGLGSGLKLDMRNTCVAIVNYLQPYL